jgi:Four helix bundle sensory module for signal transduction
MNKLHIATKLWAFITLVIVFISMVAVIGIIRGAKILEEGKQEQQVAIELLQAVTEWSGQTSANAVRTQAILLSPGNTLADAMGEAQKQTSQRIGELQKRIEAMPLRDDDKAQLAKIADLRKAMIELREKVKATKDGGDGPARLLQ